MGRNNRKNNKSTKAHSSKKNPSQLYNYQTFLANPQNQPEDTVDVCNENLTGTNHLQMNEASAAHSEKHIPVPFGVRVKRFLLANGIWGIILAALITFGGWIVVSIHKNDVDIERLSTKLEYIEKTIENLDTDGVNEDALREEIDDLKAELNAAWGLNIKDIENRINILELILEKLTEQE